MKKIQNSQTIRWKNILYILGILFFTFLVTERFIGRLNKAPDLLEQFIASKSFATSHGLNYHYINIEDLSQPVQEVFTKWPPGLSILTSFGFLFTDNVRAIYLTFSIVNILIFLLTTTYLISSLTSKITRQTIFFLLFGFYAINGFFIYGGIATDLICLNLFVFSSIFLLKYHHRHKIGWLLLACLSMVLTVYFRYAYFPALVAIPAFFLLRNVFYKSKRWKPFFLSILFTFLTSIPFISHILYINSKTGYINKVSGDAVKFYWENLKYIDPFPLSSFIEINTYLSGMGFERFKRILLYPYSIDVLFYLVSLFLIGLSVIYIRKVLSKSYYENPKNVFLSFGVILSLGLMALVYYGSLTTPSYYDDFNWSWARITRYFLVPIFILHLSFLFILLDSTSKWLRKIVIVIFSLSIFSGMLIRCYTYSKSEYKLYDYKANEEFLFTNRHNLNSFTISNELPAVESGYGVILIDKEVNEQMFMASTYLLYRNYTSMVLDETFQNNLQTSHPIDVYILTDSAQKNTSRLISQYGAKLYAELENDILIYKIHLLATEDNGKVLIF